VREATAPLLLLGGIGSVALLVGNIWVAAGAAVLVGTGAWVAPAADVELLVRLGRDGAAGVLAPGASATAFYSVFVLLLVIEGCPAFLVGRLMARHGGPGDPRRSMLDCTELGDLTGAAAVRRARQLRPGAREFGSSDHGLQLMSVDRHPVSMSWEDVGLVIMGPRSNKTSALAVPTVLAAPGLVPQG